MPDIGNTLTLREYQTMWMHRYDEIAGDATALPGVCTASAVDVDQSAVPQSLDCSRITWAGYSNGHIPLARLVYKPESGYLHPAASATYSELAQLADADDVDIRGSGYRDAVNQAVVHNAGTGATVGTSCHGLGLAIDIARLVPANPPTARQPYRNIDEAFRSPEYAWMCAHAADYGWISPRWTQPAGQVCGPVVGTGKGGGENGLLEPWHWEAAAVAVRSPDFSS